MNKSRVDLGGARVLVLEDDYYLASDLHAALEAAGAQVVGPFSDAQEAAVAIGREQPDCAFVDVNLGRGPSFELPRVLAEGNVPFAFVTGYDAETIPAEFKAIERFEKPLDPRIVAKVAQRLLSGA